MTLATAAVTATVLATSANLAAQPTQPAPQMLMANRTVVTSDGVRLAYTHYAAAASHPAGVEPLTVVFIPGWTMPAHIFEPARKQLNTYHHHVLLDPRGQGSSAIAKDGYTDTRRALDVAQVLQQLPSERIVIVAWSLAVLETLQLTQLPEYAALKPRIKGIVLVDNSVGEATPPKGDPTFFKRLTEQREKTVSSFVKNMFKSDVSAPYLHSLTQSALRTPLVASKQLLSYPGPRERWKQYLYSIDAPLAYFVTPRFTAQAQAVLAQRPATTIKIFPDAGHAIFVDEPAAFNTALLAFLETLP